MKKLLLFLSCLGFLACSPKEGGNPLALLPETLDQLVLLRDSGKFQASLEGFLGRLKGTEGLLSLLSERYGLDFRSDAGLKRLGLDLKKPMAFFSMPLGGEGQEDSAKAPPERIYAGLFSIADEKAFWETLGGRLLRGAGLEERESPPMALYEDPRNGRLLQVRVLWVDAKKVALLAFHPSQKALDLDAHFPPKRPFSLEESEPPKEGEAEIYLSIQGEGLGLFQGLGLESGLEELLAYFLEGKGSLYLSEEGLRFHLLQAHAPPKTLPLEWLQPESPEPNFLSGVFPKTSTAFLRLRMNMGKIRAFPTAFLEQLVPKRLPGLQNVPIPDAPALLKSLGDDLGIAFLGLARTTSISQVLWLLQRSPTTYNFPTLSQYLHPAFAVSLADHGGFKRAYEDLIERFSAMAWHIEALDFSKEKAMGSPHYEGWRFSKGKFHYSVFFDEKSAFFIVGDGELEPFMALMRKERLSLGAYLDEEKPGKDALSRALGQNPEAGNLGFFLSPLRLARELEERSAPPYFVGIINSLDALYLDLQIQEDGLSWRGGLRL